MKQATNITLRSDFKERAKAMAKARKISLSELVEDLLRNELSGVTSYLNEPPSSDKITPMPNAPPAGSPGARKYPRPTKKKSSG